MKKRDLSMVLALCMALTLFAGCGQQQNTEPPAATAAPMATAAPAQTATPAATPEPTAEPAALAYASGEEDYARAFDLGLVDESCAARELDEQVTSREYRAMLTALITELAPEELDYFNSKVTDYDKSMTRGEAVTMSWYTAVCIGALSYNYGPFGSDNPRMGGDFWNTGMSAMVELFPEIFEQRPVQADSGFIWDNDYTASFIWNCWHCSFYSSKQIVEFDEAAGDMRHGDPFTIENAVCAVTRLCDSVERYVSVYDERAFSPLIPGDLLQKAADTSIQSIDDLPRLTGFVLGDGYGYGHYTVDNRPKDIREIAEWGFTSSRIMLTYETLFSPDCAQVNLSQFERLDQLVAAAVQYDLHLNLLLMTLPGRTTWYDDAMRMTGSGGDFDLFINEEKMEQAKLVWRTIAARYHDISSAYLSFIPCWEALNLNLSTGAPRPQYDEYDVARGLDAMIGAIREIDPDRFIFYEPTPNSTVPVILTQAPPSYELLEAKYENLRISYNFGEGAYIAAEMSATEGANIDNNNHSMFKPEYPVTIYAAARLIDERHEMTIGGCLPAGTRLDLYVEKTHDSGTFTISTENGTLYSERLSERSYETSYKLSQYYPYATSEKKISVTLDKDTEKLTLSCRNGALEWSGMDVVLPESYAVERRYYRSGWDVYLGLEDAADPIIKLTSTVMICPNSYDMGSNITIHEDVTYSSEAVWDAANKDTIEAWGAAVSEFTPRCVVRFEDAMFSLGTDQASMLRYYDDLLAMYDEYRFDWYSNDYRTHSFDDPRLGAELVPYGDRESFNLELLQVLQKHQ